jgi:hypothetical protein
VNRPAKSKPGGYNLADVSVRLYPLGRGDVVQTVADRWDVERGRDAKQDAAGGRESRAPARTETTQRTTTPPGGPVVVGLDGG